MLLENVKFEDKESFAAEDDVVYANWLKSLRTSGGRVGSRWKHLLML